jgi:hypothetical protein
MVEWGTPALWAALITDWIPFMESGRMAAGLFILAVMPFMTRADGKM